MRKIRKKKKQTNTNAFYTATGNEKLKLQKKRKYIKSK